MNQDRWRDDERRREFERDRDQYRGYRAQPGEFDYERDVYGERYARNEGWGGRDRFQGDRERDRGHGGYGREYEHQGRGGRGGYYGQGGQYGQYGSEHFGGGRTQGADYYGGGQERGGGYERNRGHAYDWNRGYDRNEPYRSREHEAYGRHGGHEEGRSWWDRTRDEVGSWFGDEDAERRRHEDEMRGGRGETRYAGGYGERRHDTAWNDPVRGDDSWRRRDQWAGRDERRFDDRDRDYWREDHDRRDRRPW